MSYNYDEQRASLFTTESGQVMFIAIRDNVTRILLVAGNLQFGSIVLPRLACPAIRG